MSIEADGDREGDISRRRVLLDDWVSREREVAILQARQAGLLAERMDLLACDPDIDLDGGSVSLRSLAAEYGAAAHLPPSTAAVRLTDAWVLVHHFPTTYAAFAAGRLSRRHVDVILTEAPEPGDDQDPGVVRAAYEARVVPFAEADTAARTRAHARGVAAALTPDAIIAAHRRGRARRRVTVTPDGDGMALLIALLPEIQAYAIKDRLDAQARQVTKAHRANGTTPAGSMDPEINDLSRAEATRDRPAPDVTDAEAEVSDQAYDAFLASLRDDEDDTDAEDVGGAAGAERTGDSERAGEADSAGTEGAAGADSAAGASGAEADDGYEVIVLGDLGPFSPAAAEYDRTAPDTPTTPPPNPPDRRSIPDDDDVPAIDAEFEALVASLGDGFPEDPSPPDPDRRYCGGHPPPDTPIGVVDTDDRTMDQIRADVLTDILLTADPSLSTRTGLESVHATVQVTISADTLLGHDDRPAELDGVGPIDPEWARRLAGRAPSLDRLFLNHTGMVTETDNYTPTANMKRYLRARDQHCRFPGCRAPAHRCQQDHNLDHAKGGPTDIGNLALFCTGHHPLKHPDLTDDDRWTARQLPDGLIEWTSPLGRTYTDRAPTRVLFT